VQWHDLSRRLLAGSCVVVVCLWSAACHTVGTFSVDGKIGANANMVYDNGNCDFVRPVTVHADDDVVLRGADNTIVGFDHLKMGSNTRRGPGGVCDLTFHFDNVRPGDAAYQLILGSNEPIIVTEEQLRDKGFEVIPRGPSEMDGPDFDVKPKPKSG
jgi:hypothetical protein